MIFERVRQSPSTSIEADARDALVLSNEEARRSSTTGERRALRTLDVLSATRGPYSTRRAQDVESSADDHCRERPGSAEASLTHRRWSAIWTGFGPLDSSRSSVSVFSSGFVYRGAQI